MVAFDRTQNFATGSPAEIVFGNCDGKRLGGEGLGKFQRTCGLYDGCLGELGSQKRTRERAVIDVVIDK